MEAVSAPRTHPLVIAAAVSVTALSLAGIGAIFGVIPVGAVKAPASEIQTVTTTAAPTATQPAATPGAAVSRADAATTLSLPAGSSVRIDTPSDKPHRSETIARAAKPEPKPEPKKATVRDETPAATPAGYTRVANDEPPSVYAERAPRPLPPAETPAAAAPTCHDCGTVATVREVKKEGDANGIGAIAGGLLGGVLGHQVGGGRGKDVMTVVGAVGGAYAGHQVEKNQRSSTAYEVTVRLDDGSTRVVTQNSMPNWRQGERVRVSGEQISPL